MFVICEGSYLGKKRYLVLDLKASRFTEPSLLVLTPVGNQFTDGEKEWIQNRMFPYLLRKVLKLDWKERRRLREALERCPLEQIERLLVEDALDKIWNWDGREDCFIWEDGQKTK